MARASTIELRKNTTPQIVVGGIYSPTTAATRLDVLSLLATRTGESTLTDYLLDSKQEDNSSITL